MKASPFEPDVREKKVKRRLSLGRVINKTWRTFPVQKTYGLRVRAHWTDKIILARPKISKKFVSAKFSITQAWAQWSTSKHLLITSVNHTEINTIACALFARKVTWDLTSDGLMANFNASIEYVASAYYCLQSSFQNFALEIQPFFARNLL